MRYLCSREVFVLLDLLPILRVRVYSFRSGWSIRIISPSIGFAEATYLNARVFAPKYRLIHVHFRATVLQHRAARH
jgi:hypothetical protein